MEERGDCLSADELAFHRVVLAQVRAAEVVQRCWLSHLAQRYQLSEGDGVGEDGVIHRTGRLVPHDLPR